MDEVEATLTYAVPTQQPGQGTPAPTPGPFGQAAVRPGAASVLMHWSAKTKSDEHRVAAR